MWIHETFLSLVTKLRCLPLNEIFENMILANLLTYSFSITCIWQDQSPEQFKIVIPKIPAYFTVGELLQYFLSYTNLSCLYSGVLRLIGNWELLILWSFSLNGENLTSYLIWPEIWDIFVEVACLGHMRHKT